MNRRMVGGILRRSRVPDRSFKRRAAAPNTVAAAGAPHEVGSDSTRLAAISSQNPFGIRPGAPVFFLQYLIISQRFNVDVILMGARRAEDLRWFGEILRAAALRSGWHRQFWPECRRRV